MAGRQPHMLALPPGFLVLRIFQLIFAIIPLGLCIYGVVYVTLNSLILNIIIGVCTVIIIVYIFVATYGSPVIYQYWAILALEIFCLIFWLVAFACLAADVGIVANALKSYDNYYDNYNNYYYYDGIGYLFVDIFGPCAAAGAIEFILFIISLSMYSVAIHHHRNAGGHCVSGSIWPRPQFNNLNQMRQPQYVVNPNQMWQPQYVVAPVQQTGHQYQQPPPQEPLQPVCGPQPHQVRSISPPQEPLQPVGGPQPHQVRSISPLQEPPQPVGGPQPHQVRSISPPQVPLQAVGGPQPHQVRSISPLQEPPQPVGGPQPHQVRSISPPQVPLQAVGSPQPHQVQPITQEHASQ